jgi:hypothetical protein
MNLETILVLNNLGASVCTDVSIQIRLEFVAKRM